MKSKKLELAAFVDYLLANVIIMRIPVPQDTELNHYFEIMNSRGEQLEKHEVLKANLMEHLKEDKYASCLFNDIWEACANMNTYVQKNMRSELCNIVFSNDDNSPKYNNFDELLNEYKNIDGNKNICIEDDNINNHSISYEI